MIRRPARSTLVPDTTLLRSPGDRDDRAEHREQRPPGVSDHRPPLEPELARHEREVLDVRAPPDGLAVVRLRSEEHTSELQSRQYLVCRLLLEKKKKIKLRRT